MQTLLSKLHYFRISRSQLAAVNGKLEKADLLLKIAEQLHYNNFISKSMLLDIKCKTQP